MAVAAVCSAGGAPVSGSGSSGRSTSHLCLVKLTTGETVASVIKTKLYKNKHQWCLAGLFLSLPHVATCMDFQG